MPPTTLSNKAIRALILIAPVHVPNHRDGSFYHSQQMCHSSQKEGISSEMILQSSMFTWKVAVIEKQAEILSLSRHFAETQLISLPLFASVHL